MSNNLGSADDPNSPILTADAYLMLSGAPANDAVTDGKVGTATITISTEAISQNP